MIALSELFIYNKRSLINNKCESFTDFHIVDSLNPISSCLRDLKLYFSHSNNQALIYNLISSADRGNSLY
jgi:hypothetical protein